MSETLQCGYITGEQAINDTVRMAIEQAAPIAVENAILEMDQTVPVKKGRMKEAFLAALRVQVANFPDTHSIIIDLNQIGVSYAPYRFKNLESWAIKLAENMALEIVRQGRLLGLDIQ